MPPRAAGPGLAAGTRTLARLPPSPKIEPHLQGLRHRHLHAAFGTPWVARTPRRLLTPRHGGGPPRAAADVPADWGLLSRQGAAAAAAPGRGVLAALRRVSPVLGSREFYARLGTTLAAVGLYRLGSRIPIPGAGVSSLPLPGPVRGQGGRELCVCVCVCVGWEGKGGSQRGRQMAGKTGVCPEMDRAWV